MHPPRSQRRPLNAHPEKQFAAQPPKHMSLVRTKRHAHSREFAGSRSRKNSQVLVRGQSRSQTVQTNNCPDNYPPVTRAARTQPRSGLSKTAGKLAPSQRSCPGRLKLPRAARRETHPVPPPMPPQPNHDPSPHLMWVLTIFFPLSSGGGRYPILLLTREISYRCFEVSEIFLTPL